MIPTEAQAKVHLRRRWKDLPALIQPIETSTGVGVPDTWIWVYNPFTFEGTGYWLELKRGNRTLAPVQRSWLNRAIHRGIPAGVLRVWPNYEFTVQLGNAPVTAPLDCLELFEHLRLRG